MQPLHAGLLADWAGKDLALHLGGGLGILAALWFFGLLKSRRWKPARGLVFTPLAGWVVAGLLILVDDGDGDFWSFGIILAWWSAAALGFLAARLSRRGSWPAFAAAGGLLGVVAWILLPGDPLFPERSVLGFFPLTLTLVWGGGRWLARDFRDRPTARWALSVLPFAQVAVLALLSMTLLWP